MDEIERLAYWKGIGVDALRASGRDGAAELEAMAWESEDNLSGFFDCFRPDGTGLAKVFMGVVRGDEILQRLLRVYECTRESFFEKYMYFIVCRPVPATPDR